MESLATDLSQSKLPSSLSECHALIRQLLEIQAGFVKRLEALEQENRLLKEQLTLNSKNSSLPPSKDRDKKKKKRPPSGRSSGGQPGHSGHFRQLVDSAEVDAVVDCPLPAQ